MNSNHGVATIADAAAKGIKFDLTKAYNVCKRAIEEKTLAPWSAATCGWIDLFYKEKGYIPALQPDERKLIRMYIPSKTSICSRDTRNGV